MVRQIARNLTRAHIFLALVAGCPGVVSAAFAESSVSNPIGHIDATVIEGGETYLVGWACVPGVEQSIRVDFYRNGYYGAGGVFITGFLANLPVDDSSAAAASCATASRAHRFKLDVTADLRGQYAGQPIVAYAISPTMGGSNPLLGGSGHIHAQNLFIVSPPNGGDATPAINAAFQAAIASAQRPAEIYFPAGQYNLQCANLADDDCLKFGPGSGVAAAELGSIYVGGAGPDLTGSELDIANPKVGLFAFTGFQNLKLFDLAIDYTTPPFTQGTITAIGADYFTLTADAGMPPIPAGLCAAYATPDPSDPTFGGAWGVPVDRASKKMQRSPNLASNGSIIMPMQCQPAGSNSWNLYTTGGILSELSLGSGYLQFLGSDWRESVLSFDGGTNLNIEGITVYTSPGIVGLFQMNQGQTVVRQFNVLFRKDAAGQETGRLATSEADALHFQNDYAQVTIDNSYFDGIFDNIIDIGSVGSWALPALPSSSLAPTPAVTAVVGNTSTQVYIQVNNQYTINPLDWIQIVSRSTGQMKLIAQVTAVTNGWQSPLTRNVGALVQLNADFLDIDSDDILFDLSAANPGTVIQGSYFGRTRGVDILHRSPWGSVQGNTFDDPSSTAILMTDQLAWSGGPVVNGVTVSGNVFIKGGSPGGQIELTSDAVTSLVAQGPYDIVIDRNDFKNPQLYSVGLTNTLGSAVTNNIVETSTAAGALNLVNAHTTKICNDVLSPSGQSLPVVRDANSWDYPASQVACP